MGPSPDEVYRRVLDEHVSIRSQIDVLHRRTEDVIEEADARKLWDATLELCRTLTRHLDYEDGALLPLLARADAWGPARAASIDAEHRAERAMIAALAEDLAAATRTSAELVDEVAWFLRALDHDMFDEERLCLVPEALDDSPVSIDQSDG